MSVSSAPSRIMKANMCAFAAPAAHGLPPLLGNPCHVDLLTEPPDDTPPAAYPHTCCTSWPCGDKSASVRCWNTQGIGIQCCGHGLLSCASLWMARWGGDGHLMMSGTRVACRNQGGLIWLGFPSVLTRDEPCPSWVAAELGVTARACATAGDENGYLIIQLPEGSDLSLVPVPDAGLARRTRRALIITSKVPKQDVRYAATVHFRYFAPQYGEPEDSATGSAMRILAAYWLSKGLPRQVRALQRSARGGLLASVVDGATTWVGGRAFNEDQVSV